MNHKHVRRFGALLAALLLFGTLGSCKQKSATPPNENRNERVSYEELRLSEYIAPLAYTEQTVVLKSSDASRADAIWEYLLAHAKILKYPQEALDYYVSQQQSIYRHYAEEHDLSYEKVLEANGVSEESIQEEARQIVKGDLLYRYIAEDATITLTDNEKQSLFDRYVQKYAEQYGYTEEYIKENMEDLIYDSMLYDKVREYLMLHNHFTFSE